MLLIVFSKPVLHLDASVFYLGSVWVFSLKTPWYQGVPSACSNPSRQPRGNHRAQGDDEGVPLQFQNGSVHPPKPTSDCMVCCQVLPEELPVRIKETRSENSAFGKTRDHG